MKSIEKIREHLSTGKYELSAHALKRAVEKKILFFEIEEAGNNVKIIEDYPDDKYSPSCLLLGYTTQGKVIHLVVSRAEIDYVKIITVYEPDEDLFNGFEIRR
ncbi:MAG: hypothetical protein A2X61_15035 [Ignavibacteria bacterium GWB2_35_12]|nr:MAG: hypothetical protein A2X63_12265 [Ignavibacteria bacterium GWA2_35_8]OGU41780.1 MAG: hypothetical protein A2X61_15035 [Ignavibacteria bacterium GWB2_35_12]OGU86106.1 MAG: hypothetical protein A2220_06640 [Ignavibacteria bacterium RIFOXYA2_FULL_35_10]OGV24361.1 MAG: hypothetical protein A2475_05320 [Ignavibacteria bacterium RIFOXYC2_FULL_35_21]